MLSRLGCALYWFRWPVLVAWGLLVLVALPIAPNVTRALVAGGFTSADLEAARAGQLLSDRFGAVPSSLYFVYTDPTATLPADDPRFLAAIEHSVANMETIGEVERVVTP